MGLLDVQRELRRTRSVCPVCISEIDAKVIVNSQGGYLVKTCPEHGEFAVCISHHPREFEELHNFYFDLMQESYPQRDFIVRLTERCNLNCSICLAGANFVRFPDYSKEDLLTFIKKRKKRTKFDLMGAEPTVRNDITEIIRMVKEHGHIPALHTNGIRLTDENYVRSLYEAGLREVHLQFDSFDERYHRAIRSRELVDEKLHALENLEKFGISVDIKMTIVRGYNDGEIRDIFEYGLGKDCVKEIFFLGCRALGRAGGKTHTECIMPDEVIDMFCEQVPEIPRTEIKRFQKLYFALLSLLKVRKCFYVQHYLVVKGNGGWLPIHKILNLERLERGLQKYRKRKNKRSRLAGLFLLFAIAREFLTVSGVKLLKDFVVLKLLFLLGFDLSKVPRRAVLLGFITACDPFIYDMGVAGNCGKGELSYDQGEQESGAVANILRERDFRKSGERAKV